MIVAIKVALLILDQKELILIMFTAGKKETHSYYIKGSYGTSLKDNLELKQNFQI